MMTKACAQCGKEFECKPSHYDKKTYCSRACMAEGYRNRMRGADNPNFRDAGRRRCETCGGEFQSYSDHKFCSLSCRSKSESNLSRMKDMAQKAAAVRKANARGRIPKVKPPRLPRPLIKTPCVICGVEKPGRDKTCGPKCLAVLKSVNQKGDKSHRWRGGKTRDVTIRRGSREYAQWRMAVFTRDDFTCQMCLCKGGRLAAHHIRRYETHPDFAMCVWNGITLCWKCHASIRHKESKWERKFLKIAKNNAQPKLGGTE